jgi:hypothetical protein
MANNFRLNRILLLAGLAIVMAAFLVMGTSCEPGGWPIIENQSNQEVRIYTTLVRTDNPMDQPGKPTDHGIIPAITTQKLKYAITFVRRNWVYRIGAKDLSGRTVFSHDYNMDDLEKINWKITIPP